MAKCTLCNTRKGKRKCKASETFICSLCCGESRNQEKCEGCSFFKGSGSRNYRQVPHYTTLEMSNNPELEIISSVVETALCQVWQTNPYQVTDRTVTTLVELMLDQYHFNDIPPTLTDPVVAPARKLLLEIFERELPPVPAQTLVKVLTAVHRSIQRRTLGGCSYLEFISQFTGVSPGAA